MRRIAAILPFVLFVTACASAPPAEEGPANERTFAAPYERVWAAARDAGAKVWGQGVRSADADNGVIVFEPRVAGNVMSRNRAPVPRSPSQDLGPVDRQNLSIYVLRGSAEATRVSVRLESDAAENEEEDARMARKILEAIAQNLRR
jgi:hypothetical protein